MTISLARQIGALLRQERELRERTVDGVEPTLQARISLCRQKIRVLERVGRECQVEGDHTGLSEAMKAVGRIVTEIHRLAGIGICPRCDIAGNATWVAHEVDEDVWHCPRCGHTWRSHGIPRGT